MMTTSAVTATMTNTASTCLEQVVLQLQRSTEGHYQLAAGIGGQESMRPICLHKFIIRRIIPYK